MVDVSVPNPLMKKRITLWHPQHPGNVKNSRLAVNRDLDVGQ